MPGPPPKHPLLRQRRNRSATSKELAPTVQRRRRYAPALPRRDKGWHALTRAWWRDVWHSPMAVEFVEADKHALFRLAVLVDMFWGEPSKELAAEIRLEQQAFGLTPIDRRRLQWSIEEEAARRPAATDRDRQAQAEPAREAEDPRKILKLAAGG